MATYLGTTAVFQVMSGATAGNVNGGGFNIANTHFATDGVIAGGTGSTASITPTSSYTFVTLDATNAAWVFFPVQTGVTYPTWAQIASVAGGVATLNTGIGQCVQIINNRYVTNTSAGIASTNTPTLTYGVDYSQQIAAQYSNSVLTGTTTSCTDATNPFTSNMIGNFICIASGTGITAGWYEITNVVSGTCTLDRTAGTSYSSGVCKIGGAVSLGGTTAGITDLIFFGLGNAGSTTGCRYFIQGNATYSPTNATVLTGLGTSTWPVIIEGYNSVRGDRPSISSGTQPTIAMTTHNFSINDYNMLISITVTCGANSNGAVFYTGQSVGYVQLINCKATNTNTSANTAAIVPATGPLQCIGCEVVSYNGYGINIGVNNTHIIGCYIHDSNIGVRVSSGVGTVVINNIISGCKTENIILQNLAAVVYGNTIYGAETSYGIGIAQPYPFGAILNNIIYGFVSGQGGADTEFGGWSDYNCYYNNTNNIAAGASGTYLGAHDTTATSPAFTNLAEVVGTTATSSTTTLTDSGKNFTTAGVVAGRDYLNVTASTGGTVAQYGIVTVGTTTLTTDNSLGTGTGVHYQITIGRNWLPGTALSGLGFPTTFSGLTSNSAFIGASTPTPSAGSAGMLFRQTLEGN